MLENNLEQDYGVLIYQLAQENAIQAILERSFYQQASIFYILMNNI